MNSFGEVFRVTIFGESHGQGIGVTVEGYPPGKEVDVSRVQKRLDQRKPGTSKIVSQRRESDQPEAYSGVLDGKATGSPITFLIRNEDVKSDHYRDRMHTPRPGHADYTAYLKYGESRDWRGGAHFSGRLTAPLVIAGALAEQILEEEGISTIAHTVKIGDLEVSDVEPENLSEGELNNEVLCAEEDTAQEMVEAINTARKNLNSLGGIVEGVVKGIPGGIGEVFFGRADARLSHLCMAVPAVKGIEFGAGFAAANMTGKEHNDPFRIQDGEVITETNNAGGVLGGLTTGMPVVFRSVVKPTSSIPAEQRTVDLKKMEETTLEIKGRHDPCIVPRAVPVIRACASIVFADLLLIDRGRRGGSDAKNP